MDHLGLGAFPSRRSSDLARVRGMRQGGLQRAAGGTSAGGVAVEAEHDAVGEAQQLAHVLLGAGGAQRGDRIREAELGDRKSTRLNSSHGYTSYAVICMKK